MKLNVEDERYSEYNSISKITCYSRPRTFEW